MPGGYADNWDDHQMDNVQWGAGIADMTTKKLHDATVDNAVPTKIARKEQRDQTTGQDADGLEASQHAAPLHYGEQEKRQLQPQPKPKPKLRLKQQSEQEHEPQFDSVPTLTRRWETVQCWTQSQQRPVSSGPTPTSGPSMAERSLILTLDESVPLPNKMFCDQ
jgi:hypothetical protein